MLNRAQIVFWIGPQIEGYLVKPLASLSHKTLIVRLAKRINSSRKFRLFSENHHLEQDPHIWLDPRKAVEMAIIIADALSLADFKNATLYKKNRDLTIAKLAQLEDEITKIISPVSNVPHMVFHNAYGHFQKRFGLASKGVVALDISRPVGAKRISMLRRGILDLQIVCLFREPQFTSTIANTIIDGTSARLGVLDPLGSGLKPGPSLYPLMMRRLAKSFSDCLDDKG
jgi:zinc transport system substrate-binding protein